MIKALELDVKLGGNTILSGIEFEAKAGQVTAIIGPNGSGKTTLLRALCGELSYRGTASLNGLDIASSKAIKLAAQRAVLAQFSSVAFPYTVTEVVSLGIAIFSPAASQATKELMITETLERVGLEGFKNRYYHELSGGEQQRVQLARALCQVWEATSNGSPKWLFLDEPVSSLDIQHQLRIMEIARQFAADGGGIIAIMHDLNLTTMYADRIILMSGGSILRVGTPIEVMQNKWLKQAFECDLKVSIAPSDDEPFLLPQSVKL